MPDPNPSFAFLECAEPSLGMAKTVLTWTQGRF